VKLHTLFLKILRIFFVKMLLLRWDSEKKFTDVQVISDLQELLLQKYEHVLLQPCGPLGLRRCLFRVFAVRPLENATFIKNEIIGDLEVIFDTDKPLSEINTFLAEHKVVISAEGCKKYKKISDDAVALVNY